MTVDVNRLDTDPASFPWWRVVSGAVDANSSRLTTLISNGTADYKQLSASLEGLTQQYNDLKTYVDNIPVSETRGNSSSGWSVGVLAPSYGTLFTQSFVVPDNKNYVVISSSMQVQYYSGGGGAEFAIDANGVLSRRGFSSGSGFFGTSTAIGTEASVTPGSTITVKAVARYYAPAAGAHASNLLDLNTIVSWRRV